MEMTKLSPAVHAAVKCWVLVESYHRDEKLEMAYAMECKLFSEHFPKFTEADAEEYRVFVGWLNHTEMWLADLTINEMYQCYQLLKK